MYRHRVLMLLGVLVLLSPWSGLPLEWLQWVLLVLGLLIVGTAYLRMPRQRKREVLPPPAPEPSSRSSHIAFS